MSSDFAKLAAKIDALAHRQSQLEEGLHLLLDAIAVQAPLLVTMSDQVLQLADVSAHQLEMLKEMKQRAEA